MSKDFPETAESPEVSDDDAPEEVAFGASKDKALGELKQIKGTIKEIKANAKLKRKNQQERNQKRKAEKLKDLDKLPDSVLENLPSYDETEDETSDVLGKTEREKSTRKPTKVGKNSTLGIKEDNLSFIPFKQKKKTKSNIKVVSLEKTNPNQAIPAVNFRDQMLYGANINRRPDVMTDASIAVLAILRHYFKLGHDANEAARKIREVEGNDSISDATAQNWFERFKDGHLSLGAMSKTEPAPSSVADPMS